MISSKSPIPINKLRTVISNNIRGGACGKAGVERERDEEQMGFFRVLSNEVTADKRRVKEGFNFGVKRQRFRRWVSVNFEVLDHFLVIWMEDSGGKVRG